MPSGSIYGTIASAVATKIQPSGTTPPSYRQTVQDFIYLISDVVGNKAMNVNNFMSPIIS